MLYYITFWYTFFNFWLSTPQADENMDFIYGFFDNIYQPFGLSPPCLIPLQRGSGICVLLWRFVKLLPRELQYVQNGLEIISQSEQRTLLCLTTSDKEGIPNITFDDKSQRRLDNCANEKFSFYRDFWYSLRFKSNIISDYKKFVWTKTA